MSEEFEELEDEELEDDLDRGDDVEDEEDEDDDSDDVEGNLDDDPEDEEDEDEEDEVDEASEEEVEDAKIPKSRLNEVIAQREAQKERVQWLEDQLETLISQKQTPVEKPAEPTRPVFDFSKAEEEYASFLIDGETSKAAALRNQIDTERKAEFSDMIKSIKEDSIKEATSKSSETLEQDKFDALIGNFENKHPFLDADSDDYNEEAVDTINTLLSGYMAAGKSKSQALKLSVSKVVPMYSTEEPKNKGLGNTRKTKARRKAAKASNAQPNRSSSKGVKDSNPDAVDVGKMTERAYSKLTAKEKRILRGD